MTPLEKGAPVTRNWRTINTLGQEVSALRARLPAAGTSRDARGLHPFQIYHMAAGARTTPTADATADWRRFLVRSGYVLGVKVDGTEGTDGADWPDSGAFVPAATGEFLVPDNEATHWVWLQKAGDTWAVQHDADPADPATAEPWESFPVPDTTNIPIGFIDTDTYSTEKLALIRQFLRADIVSVGSAGITFYGEWEAKAYDAQSMVTVSAGTNIGTYVCTTAALATDLPENGAPWAQLPSFGNGYWV